jgi:hypothetical protein
MCLMVFLAGILRHREQEDLYGMDGTAPCSLRFVLAFFALAQKALGTAGFYWLREISDKGNPFGPFVNKTISQGGWLWWRRSHSACSYFQIL